MEDKKDIIQEHPEFKKGHDMGMRVAIDILKHKFDEALEEIVKNFKLVLNQSEEE